MHIHNLNNSLCLSGKKFQFKHVTLDNKLYINYSQGAMYIMLKITSQPQALPVMQLKSLLTNIQMTRRACLKKVAI